MLHPLAGQLFGNEIGAFHPYIMEFNLGQDNSDEKSLLFGNLR